MSDNDRKKKDGQDTNKKNQRMREDIAERHEHPINTEPSNKKTNSGREPHEEVDPESLS